MEQRVVVGVDGSDPGWRAVDWAADEAVRHGLSLHVVHATRWERYENVANLGLDRPSARVMAENIVATAERRAAVGRPDLKVTGETRAMDSVEALVEEGRSAYAVVVGTRGHGALAGALLGSVSLGVAGRATCPTVVVRDTAADPAEAQHTVVLGVDDMVGSPAVSFAFREAAARGRELHAVHAWRLPSDVEPEGPEREAAVRRADAMVDQMLRDATARHPEVAVHRDSVEGSAQHVLVEAAAQADLLVVGARGRHRRVGLELGLISHAALHHAPCPVAVVPHD
ncbi:nucleotide-binding universal stress UspA family protein [Streptomyces sp. Amel2xB2]|uniref:universal stress protein n=1 Tax=Streptomyces sp. Amel2xB2 TaxID=1305829 RepID=UPI000DBA14AB|nr:universal stress protein [Streptomyces sp. Amel2xB2]RAJ66569.1 nucleotide-binding universal stress UspA family protein [Streptomyces sp. Amel2xB2]